MLPLLLACLMAVVVISWVYWRTPLENQLARGKPEPQYQLGMCYYRGFGVVKSYATAAKWFRLAATQGHAKAQTQLGIMYVHGTGVRRNYQAALTLFRKAADKGLDAAQNQLGMLYAQGKGVPQDLDEAAKWFSEAANRGCPAAEQNLKMLAAIRPGFLASLTLRSGRIYRAVKVQKVQWDAITIEFQPHQGGVGIAKVALSDLPAELQQKYGYRPGAPVQLANSTQLAEVAVQSL